MVTEEGWMSWTRISLKGNWWDIPWEVKKAWYHPSTLDPLQNT